LEDTIYWYTSEIPPDIKKFSNKPIPPKQNFSFFGELIAIMRKSLIESFIYSRYHRVEYESAPEELSHPKVFTEVSKVVSAIREVGPDTIILLSYIPTPGAIYGPDINHCLRVTRKTFPRFRHHQMACEISPARQIANSRILRSWAAQQEIHYIDPTPVLNQHGEKEILHLYNDPHFNDEGNRIYSKEIAKKIISLMSLIN
jgi:hypothetical protein